MRIVGGSRRGLRLDAPEGLGTRPTSERAREALFSILGGAAYIDRLRARPVADFFAGTGAVGLEAISRGAASCTFLETDPKALAALTENVKRVNADGRATILKHDATKPPDAPAPCGTVFLDPPYSQDVSALALVAAQGAGWLAEDAIAVVQVHPKAPFEAPWGFKVKDDRRYGATRFLILERTEGQPG